MPKPKVSSARLRSTTSTRASGRLFFIRIAKYSPAGPPPITSTRIRSLASSLPASGNSRPEGSHGASRYNRRHTVSTPNDNRRRSRVAVEGLDRTPHRTFLRAMGLDDAAIAKPFVAVISTHGENTPCSMSLRPQADAAKIGRRRRRRHAVRDDDHLGLRRRVDEPPRHADEPRVARVDRRLGRDRGARRTPTTRSSAFAGCDKTLPGDDDGDGAPQLPERLHVRRRDAARRVARAHGQHDRHLRGRRRGAGRRDERGRPRRRWSSSARRRSAPARASSPPTRWRWCRRRSASRCPARRCCRRPTPSASRSRAAAGETVMRILRDGGPLPRDLVTRKSLENACAAVAATGGSTNAGLHLPAIAHEAGIRFTLDDVAEVFRRTPLDRRPAARRQVPRARPALRRRRVARCSRRCSTAATCTATASTLSGRTLEEALAAAPGRGRQGGAPGVDADPSDRRRRGAQGQPLPRRRADQDRRAEARSRSRAPRACSSARRTRRPRSGRARYRAGDVLVIRNEGPGRRARHARDARRHRARSTVRAWASRSRC